MTNTNMKTGIPFGYISAQALHPEVVDELLYEAQGEWDEVARIEAAELGYVEGTRDFDDHVDYFVDKCTEPVLEGEYEGVTYRASWLGGALHFWIFESPVTTNAARKASPCVPGAAILDTLDGSEFGYDVPADWRDSE